MSKEWFLSFKNELSEKSVELIAVSKYRSKEEIMKVYELGHRKFGENRVGELLARKEKLPRDIEWHMIGTIQKKKAKKIVGETALIHSVDSLKLLNEINKRAEEKQAILIQVNISKEEQKHGFTFKEADELINSDYKSLYPSVKIRGFMGMAELTDEEEVIRSQFKALEELYNKYSPPLSVLSMGMSADYELAIECGANTVRIGSLIFDQLSDEHT